MISTEPLDSPEAADFAARTADIPESFGSAPTLDGNALPTGEPEQPPIGGLTVDAIKLTFEQISKMAATMVKGGEFWQLQSDEARNLAEAWHPILAPLWARWMSETNGNLLPAIMVTTMSLLPRLGLEAARRASSQKGSTATAKSGASQPFSDPPVAENPLRPTDSLLMPVES